MTATNATVEKNAQTNAKSGTQRKPKRYVEFSEGITLEYEIVKVPTAQLFGLEEIAANFPALQGKSPVRKYYLSGTDEVFDHPLVPKVEYHIFDIFELAILLPYFINGKGLPPYLYGLAGTGKSSVISQLHARLGMPLVSVILGEDSEVIDLGGQMLPNELGGMKFSYGLLVQAMKNGWSLIFDEYDLLPSRQQKMLNNVLEVGRFTIESTGEVITADKNFRVCAIGNTNNTGGNSMFASKSTGDASVNERFQFIEKFYLDKESEARILARILDSELPHHPRILRFKDEVERKKRLGEYKLSMEKVIDTMLTVCNDIRDAHKRSFTSNSQGMAVLECTMSTRVLKKWLTSAITMSAFFEGAKDGSIVAQIVKRAFELSFAKGVSYDEQELVIGMFDNHF